MRNQIKKYYINKLFPGFLASLEEVVLKLINLNFKNDYIFKNLLIIFSLSSFTAGITGQDFKFNHLTSQEGLSNNTVYSIYKDRDGFIWFGTSDGLNKYDGYNIQTFYSKVDDTTSISGNTIFHIKEDQKNNMWIATENGVNIFNKEHMDFQRIPLVVNETFTDLGYVRSFYISDNQDVLVGTESNIFIYDELNQCFRPFLNHIDDFFSLKREGIESFIIDRNNRIWIGSKSFGLFVYDLDNNELVASPLLDNNIKIDESIFKIAYHQNGDIWIGTIDGIFIVKPDLTHQKLTFPSEELVAVGTNRILYIFFDSKNRTWIGTDGAGVIVYNNQDGSYAGYTYEETNKTSINNNSVRRIYEDNQGIVWLGTYRGGVNFVYPENNNFITYQNVPDNKQLANYNVVSSVFIDSDNDIWVGTDGGGLFQYDANMNKLKHFYYHPDVNNSLSGNAILTISEDSSGKIWAGGYLMGINIIDKSTGKVTVMMHEPNNPNSLSNDDVRDIYFDNNNQVWIATNGGGVNLFNPVTEKFTHFTYGSIDSISNDWCVRFYEDRFGNLWIGTHNGANVYDREKEIFISYTRSDNPGSISHNWVYDFAEDTLGNIWVGTANGLNHFNRETKEFSTTFKGVDLPKNIINNLHLDRSNNLWMATSHGLIKFITDKLIFDYFYPDDGFQVNQFIRNASFKDNDGYLYLGGDKGLTVFHPDSLSQNEFIPPVYINKLLIFFEEIYPGKNNQVLNKSINKTDEIVLSHQHSVFTLELVSLNYIHSDKNEYAYMLEGLDRDWNYIGTRREVTFTRLGYGTYTFRAKASNNDGVWNDSGTSIKITILPPFYHKLWFRVTLLALVLISVGYYVISLINKMKREKQDILKKSSISLFEERNQLRTLIDNMPDFIYIKDIYSRFVVANKRTARSMLGHENYEHLIGKTDMDFLPEEFAKKYLEDEQKLFETKKPLINIVETVPDTDSKLIYISTTKIPLIDINGEIIGLVGMGRDITNYIKTEERLKQQTEELQTQAEKLHEANSMLVEKQTHILEQSRQLKLKSGELETINHDLKKVNATKDMFFSIIAHDLKSPFNIIMGFAELLELRYDKLSEGQKRKYISSLYHASDKTFALLESLLQWSGFQRGRIEINPVQCDLNEIVNDINDLNMNRIKDKNIEFITEIPVDANIFVDSNMINTVLRNLISNAVKFTENGKVIFKVSKEDDTWYFEISDTGIGMPEDVAKSLFELKKHKSSEGTRGEKGTGFGLLICKEFIDMCNGEISVKTIEGEGTTFRFSIPIQAKK